jgi:hypothetical protein
MGVRREREGITVLDIVPHFRLSVGANSSLDLDRLSQGWDTCEASLLRSASSEDVCSQLLRWRQSGDTGADIGNTDLYAVADWLLGCRGGAST